MYERVNINCAEVNSTRVNGGGIYFFNFQINDDRAYCEHLAAKYDKVSVVYGNPGSEEVLSDAGIKGADVMIALSGKDADNLEVCQLAKQIFSVRKTICMVKNPGNVEIFKELGIDQVISPVHILAQYIPQSL